jgi:hypothetical protein
MARVPVEKKVSEPPIRPVDVPQAANVPRVRTIPPQLVRGPINPVEIEEWLREIYDITKVSDEELKQMYDQFQYQGFNRLEVLAEIKVKGLTQKQCVELVVLCALRGPQRAATVKLSNGRTPSEIGIPGSGAQGRRGLTCQRVTAATADLAAFYLKKLQVPKRLAMDCPAWLQFPSAGSIRMPSRLRVLHLEFAKRFSSTIGGVFNEQIYLQMEANAYLDDNLKLFDDI